MGVLADRLGIGKSSTFVAYVTVHEISQVPLVNAKFRVKWKFKGATTSSHVEHHDGEDSGGHAHRFLHPRSALHNSAPPPSSSRSTSPASDARDSMDDSTGSSRRPHSPPNSPPLSPVDLRTPNPNRTPSTNHPSSFAFTSPFSSNSEQVYSPGQHTPGHLYSNTSTPDDSPNAHNRRRGGGDLNSMPPSTPPQNRTEPKGATSFIPLRNHTATFSREIHCPVSIPLRSIAGGRYQLLPSPVKLSIKQEVIGDEGKKEETKTGEVLLDLSQFVGNGRGEGAPRRYLLRDCKTNATLKVTVKMEFAAGEASFVAPPLKTGQVPANSSHVSGLGSSSSSINNRSSASLASRGKQQSQASRSSSTSMLRTDSSSSISTRSIPSTESGSSPGRKKQGWRPNSSMPYSSSPSPTLLGAGSGEADRNATDLIETLFNRPSRQGSWSTLPSAVPSTTSLNGQTSGDALVFSVGRGKRTTTANSATTIVDTKGKGKERDSSSGWGFRGGAASFNAAPSPSRTPSSLPPIRTSPTNSARQTAASPSELKVPPRMAPRRSSISVHSVASSKKPSVRWGDDESGAGVPPPPNQRTTSSVASSILSGRPNGNNGGKTGILRSESSESSLESVSSQGSDRLDPKQARPSGLSRASSTASKSSIKSAGTGPGGGKVGIQWASSWE